MFDNTTWAFAGLVIFMAILGYLGVFGYFGKALDKRARDVAGELEQAKTLREEAEALLAEYRQKQTEAEQQAAEIIAGAEAEAARITAAAESSIEDLIERRTAAVDAKIALAEESAIADVRGRAVDVAIAAAATILRDKVTDEVAAELIAKGVAEAKARLN